MLMCVHSAPNHLTVSSCVFNDYSQVNPPAVGFLFCFVGTSWVVGWYGHNHWK